MANKYINTFNTTSDFKAYTASDEMAVPNIAYLLDTDEVKYLSVIPRAVKVGSIVYNDNTFTWPDEPLADGKTPIGVVYISQDDTPFNDGKSRVIATKAIGSGKMSITGQKGDGSLANEKDGIVCSDYYLNKFGDDSEALTKASNYTIGGIVGWYIPSLFESKLLPYNVSLSEANENIINKSLTKIGGNIIYKNQFGNTWTSTNIGEGRTFMFSYYYIDEGFADNNGSDQNYRIWPAVALKLN